MSNARDKEEFVVTRKDLRQLLFWAAHGVRASVGGSYSDTIVMVIPTWTERLGLSIPYHIPFVQWGADRREKRK